MQFTINSKLDPDGPLLRPILEAHLKYERTNEAKSVYLHLLAIVGVLVWLGAMWPALIPAQMEEFVLILWGALLVLAAWASVEAWAWHRKLTRYLGEHEAIQRGDAGKPFDRG